MASNFTLPPLPDNFKPVGHLLKTAHEHETRDAVVTYWARLAAFQSAMAIDKKSKEAKAILIPLMDWLEKEKKVSELGIIFCFNECNYLCMYILSTIM